MAPTHRSPSALDRNRSAKVLFTLPLLLGACTVGPMIFAACRAEPAAAPEAESPAPTAAAPVAQEPPVSEPSTLAKGIAPAPTPEPGTPAVEAAPPEPAAPPSPPVEPEPKTPHRVLILGDSLAATGFGALLEKKLDAHADVECFRKGKSASGLARPDFFDWPTEAGKQLDFRKPNLVVVIMGGNDGQDLTRKKGKRVSWSDPDAWKADYRTRMDEFLASLVADDRKVLWLGLPTMGMRSLETKLETIRQIQREAVEALGDRARYVDTAPFVTADDGSLLAEAKVGGSKKPQAIRAEDRIHFTMSGSEYFADKVLPEVLGVLGVEAAP
jgi:hypothetical protein